RGRGAHRAGLAALPGPVGAARLRRGRLRGPPVRRHGRRHRGRCGMSIPAHIRAQVVEEVAHTLRQRMSATTATTVSKAAVLRHLELEASAARTAARITQGCATPDDAARQVAHLPPIGAEGDRCKAGRARKALATLGYRVAKGSAGADLARLARAGHLVRHDEPGVTYYTRTSTTGTR